MINALFHPIFPNFSYIFLEMRKGKDRIVNLFLQIFSAKQTVRPDSLYESISESLPPLWQAISFQCTKLFFVLRKLVGLFPEKTFQNDVAALNLINRIEKKLEQNQHLELSDGDKQLLAQFFSRLINTYGYSDRLKNFIVMTHQNDLFKPIKGSIDLLKVLHENVVDSLQVKIDKIKTLLENPTSNLEETAKLLPAEYRLLFLSRSKKMFLEFLTQQGVVFDKLDELTSKWNKLHTFYRSPTMQKLRELSLTECKPGRIFLGHRYIMSKMRDEPFNIRGVIKNIVQSSFNHTAIFTQGPQGIHLSHVGSVDRRHSVKPIVDPVLFSFCRFIDLDISPLLPSNVSEEHRSLLKETFAEAFQALAAEERPGITYRDEGESLYSLFIGHLNLFPTELSSIDIKPNQAMRCDIFVATIFLKAVQRVNEKIASLGYPERIAHPFGRYESLNRMDILRLYYLFKRVNIVKPASRNPLLLKIISSATALSS